MAEILILYYSRTGHTKMLAREIEKGIFSHGSCDVKMRTVAPLTGSTTSAQEDNTVIVTKDDLKNCDGLALGSPTRFGSMATPLKVFFDQTSDIWMSGHLIDKPAVVFTSTSSMHGGQEATLLSMTVPLLHHGMIILGIPYSDSSLMDTSTGGTPYGASHLAGSNNKKQLSKEEESVAKTLGKRLAKNVIRLKDS
ncbi:MAG: NAD(P)H:quinone oxidoreductase [Pseudomonadota bacterium]|nr:NAD(P)H:quinone oxidoreductase [Pseudomonadota bacterium]